MIYLLLFLLFTKHLIIDFFWQPEYEWKNKGTYLHPGGLVHSLKHIVGTYFILLFFIPFSESLRDQTFLFTALLATEFVIHYHMDWFKMNWCKKKGYDPYHPKFWYWLGIDQYVHVLTYLLLVIFI